MLSSSSLESFLSYDLKDESLESMQFFTKAVSVKLHAANAAVRKPLRALASLITITSLFCWRLRAEAEQQCAVMMFTAMFKTAQFAP
jgi:uncharacterized protein involved in tolerance to divalent cations